MQDLYQWKAVDKFGKVVTYQTKGPACVTEAEMREHLQAGFPHLTIIALDRVQPSDWKPATGIIQRHAFTHGILEQVEAELGLQEQFGASLLTYGKKVKYGNPRDARDFGVELQRQFENEVKAAHERRLSSGRSALGVARSLLKPYAR